MNKGFRDAINKYDDKQTSLDKAVDDFQNKVSIIFFSFCLQQCCTWVKLRTNNSCIVLTKNQRAPDPLEY